MPSLASLADEHQDRLLARADRSADAAERAVRKVWLAVLAAIKAGGPPHVVHAAVWHALRGLPAVAGEVRSELAGVARDSAWWTATKIAGKLTNRQRLRLFEKDEFGGFDPPKPPAGTAAAAAPDPGDRIVIGAILPPITSEQVNAVLYSSGWESRIQALTRLAPADVLAARVASLVAGGATIQQIASEIRPTLQNVQVSARRTARTAGLYVAHEAELATYERLGDMIEGYQIHAVLDHATRPEHRRRDGRKYYRVPQAGQRGFDEMPRPPREADGSWAFNCLLPEMVVQGTFDLALKSRYSGQVVEIETRSGRTIRVTSNHPVCTASGFLSANKIHEGDYLVRYWGEHRRTVSNDEQQPPTRVDEVFRAAEKFGPAATERGSVFDLHGDAAFGDGKIQVVRLGCKLRDDDDSTSSQFREQVGLVPALVSESGLPSCSAPRLHLDRVDLPASGRVRGSDLPTSFGRSHSRPFRPLRIGPAADLNASRYEYPIKPAGGLVGVGETAATDSEFVGELLHRFSGVVSPDHVVKVRKYDWSGHVYDLQSPGGWIVANELILSNCRCFLSPILA